MCQNIQSASQNSFLPESESSGSSKAVQVVGDPSAYDNGAKPRVLLLWQLAIIVRADASLRPSRACMCPYDPAKSCCI